MEIPINDVLIKAVETLQQGSAFVLATVVVGAEKTPGRSGFKLISYSDGSFAGTVGGGKLERLVMEECRRLHESHENSFQEYNLTDDENGIGMLCGGVAKVFFEYFSVGRKAFVFGAGHLCRSLVPILRSLSFYTIVIDNRPEYVNLNRIPQANEVISSDYEEFISKFKPGREDTIVIFTHGHLYDYDILDQICRKNLQVKYLGMIGSKNKVKEALKGISQAGYKGNLVNQIHAPIGLNIGKRTTQEIAIAIAAEILAIYNGVKEIRSLTLTGGKNEND